MLSSASSSEDGWRGRFRSSVHCWGGSRLPSYSAGMASISGSSALECPGRRVRATGLGERSRLGWEYEGRVSGSVDDGSVVLHLVYENLTPHRFDGRRISEGRMDGRIAGLGDVTFTRPGYR